ncbi:hypothetical protein AVEN_137369-1 [Araneus ventricosus]|uniref:Uncharacterized protein n=1 Tax=Araneus ventricosus TaxID=182803 RepID=A0A4Y2E163_ARAVE|nr:hypothetical protein AVEN_137369-1 [Araneus ventricosus]
MVEQYHTEWRPGWPRSRRIPGSKSDSTENPSCIGPVACEILRRVSNILPMVWCGSLERWCQPRFRRRHLITVRNSEIRPKIALVLLRNGTLI